jgi:hypothetical protein
VTCQGYSTEVVVLKSKKIKCDGPVSEGKWVTINDYKWE